MVGCRGAEVGFDDGGFAVCGVGCGGFGAVENLQPEEGVGGEREGVGLIGDAGEGDVAEHLDGDAAREVGEVELYGLGEAREVGEAEDGLAGGVGTAVVAANIGEDFAVFGAEEFKGATTEDLEEFAQGDHVAGPVEEGGLIAELGFYVDGLVAVDGIHDDGEVETCWDGGGESGVAVGVPLHGGADAVAVAEVDVVAHADLVAVVEDGGSGEAEEERVEEFDAAAVVVDEGCEASADAYVDAHTGVGGVGEVHVVALVVGDHFKGELVVVAEEETPLAVVGERGGLGDDVGDGKAIFLTEGHVDAGHEGEVEGHVALVAIAEVGADVGGPLVGFGEDEAVGVALVDGGADFFDSGVGFGEAFAAGSVALVEIGDGVHAHAVYAEVEPEAHGFEDFFEDGGIVEVEVGLVGEEAVPVEGLGGVVPGPVGGLGVFEDDGDIFVALVGGGPDVHFALGGAGWGVAGGLKPGMLVGGVVDDELDDDLHVAAMGFGEEVLEVVEGAVAGVDVDVVGDVVAVVAEGRGEEGEEPEAGDAEILEVVEAGDEAGEVADAVAVGVLEGADVQLVDDGVFVPERIGGATDFLHTSLAFVRGWSSLMQRRFC